MTDATAARPTVHPDLLRAEERNAPRITIGPWTLIVRAGEIDEPTWNGVLVLRGVRVVVRDRDWRTVPSRDVSIEPDGSDGFVVSGRAVDGAIGVDWTLRARFSEESATFSVIATAEQDLLRNRLGLIVLHGPDLAGTPLTIIHPDGTTTSAAFPTAIAPHQPAVDIQGLRWKTRGVAVDLALSGDVFEMEDQRNWTDASFKTYSTPLSRPFPVAVAAGETIEQEMRIVVARQERVEPVRTEADAPPAVHRITIGAASGARVPRIAASASTAPDADRPPISRAPVDEILVEPDPREPAWRAALGRAVADAAGRPLDVRIVAGTAEDVDLVLAAILDDLGAATAIARIGVFDASTHVSEPALVTALRAALDRRGLALPVVGGTRAHFTEVNRTQDRILRDDPARSGGPDEIAFSITPFMHDRSGHQLVESLAMQRLVAEQAVRIAQGRPVRVGPVTLGARFNAVATSPIRYQPSMDTGRGSGPQHVLGATDDRQTVAALSAWVLGSVAALSVPGVASVALFEEWGPRGIRRADPGRGAVDPIAALVELESAVIRSTTASATGSLVTALAAESEGSLVLLLGSLAAETLIVEPVFASGHRAEAVRIEPGSVVRVALPVDPATTGERAEA